MNTGKQLFHKDSGITFVELATIDDFIEEFSTLNVIGHNVETLVIFKVLIDLDNVGVIKITQCLDFVEHGFLFSFIHSLFLEELDSALFLGLTVSAEANLAESTFTKNFADLVNVAESAFSLQHKHL